MRTRGGKMGFRPQNGAFLRTGTEMPGRAGHDGRR